MRTWSVLERGIANSSNREVTIVLTIFGVCILVIGFMAGYVACFLQY